MAVRFLEWERKMLSKRLHNWPRWSRFPIQEIYQDASCFRDRSITFYTDMMGLHAFSHISTQRLGTQRKCLCLFSAAHTDRLCCSLLFLSLLLFITFLKLGFVSKCLSNFAISWTVSVCWIKYVLLHTTCRKKQQHGPRLQKWDCNSIFLNTYMVLNRMANNMLCSLTQLTI